MRSFKHQAFCLLLLAAMMAACSRPVQTFDPMVGMEGDTVCMDMDMTDAVIDGIVLSAIGETFRFAFDTLSDRQLYYKIYY